MHRRSSNAVTLIHFSLPMISIIFLFIFAGATNFSHIIKCKYSELLLLVNKLTPATKPKPRNKSEGEKKTFNVTYRTK